MLNLLFTISTGLLVVLSFGLGIFSIIRDPKSRVVQLWFLMSMAIGLWSLAFLFLQISKNLNEGILYSKLLHVGASLIPIFFYNFVVIFSVKKYNRKVLYFGYLLAGVFSILSFTEYIVLNASPKFNFNYWVDAGSLYLLLLIYFWIYVTLSVYKLYIMYVSSDGVIKKKAFFIFLASLIGFLGGGTSFFPQTIGVYSFGQFFTWLYPVLVTHGIFLKK